LEILITFYLEIEEIFQKSQKILGLECITSG